MLFSSKNLVVRSVTLLVIFGLAVVVFVVLVGSGRIIIFVGVNVVTVSFFIVSWVVGCVEG